MGVVRNQGGVLKLVHPGGVVEVRREPVPAARIMEENPRHCVTRPDVFRFPWVVVSPDSLLRPGEVFYIVPNRTIRGLLRRVDSTSPFTPSPSALLLLQQQRHRSACRHQSAHQQRQQPLPSPPAAAENNGCFYKWLGRPFAIDLETPSQEHSGPHHATAGSGRVQEEVNGSALVRASTATNSRGRPSPLGSSVAGHAAGHRRNYESNWPRSPRLKSCLKEPDRAGRSGRHSRRVRFNLPGGGGDFQDADDHLHHHFDEDGGC